MRLYFDESGDFGFPDDRFDAYTQAVLICPDSKLARVEEYVAAQCAEWGMDELHATSLSDDQLWQVCRFMRSERLPGLVQATDTNAMTRKTIAEHRLAQAVRVHENFRWWEGAGGKAWSIAAWYQRHVGRMAYAGRVPDSEWVQADLLISLVHRALNKTIYMFLDDKWRDDFRDFRFIFDAKLEGKLAAGEKYLNDVLLPALGSNRGRMDLVGVKEWRDPPVHPFEERYGTGEGTLDLKKLFEHGLEFERSHDHAGLQLADALAYLARRRILEPESNQIRLAWQTVRPLLVTHRGQGLYIMRYSTGGADADTARYENM